MHTRLTFTVLFFSLIFPVHADIPGIIFPLLFEKPTFVTVVPLTHYAGDEASSATHSAYFSLSCHYYPTFMVKELNTNEKGASKLSITPSHAHSPLPCQETTPGENILEHSGYFLGVKEAYVFFRSDDSHNGALGITIYSPNGERVFQDVHGSLLETRTPSTITKEKDGALTLHYTGFFEASCSLFGTSKDQCWKAIQKVTGLQGSRPQCLTAHSSEYQSQERKAYMKKTPTVLEYKVRTQITKTPVTIHPSPSAQPHIYCWPSV